MTSVPLSKVQQDMLEKYQVPEGLKFNMARALGKDGEVLDPNQPDFLQLLSNNLQNAENTLQIKRTELSAELNKIKGYQDKPRQIEALEEAIREYWATATALWRAADQVINQPEPGYKLVLSKKHAQYAIEQKNLPILMLIKWAKPEWFTLSTISPIQRRVSAVLGAMGGALLGLFAGFAGGFRLGFTRQVGLTKLIAISFAVLGIFTGWANGGIMGARMGYQTGNPWTSSKFGAWSAYTNPLNEPSGTQNRHAIELKMEALLFKGSELELDTYNKLDPSI